MEARGRGGVIDTSKQNNNSRKKKKKSRGQRSTEWQTGSLAPTNSSVDIPENNEWYQLSMMNQDSRGDPSGSLGIVGGPAAGCISETTAEHRKESLKWDENIITGL